MGLATFLPRIVALNPYRIVVPVCALVGLVPPYPLAATLNVPSEYPTIEAAVDAAADGDSIVVATGSYAEPGIRIAGKRLSIIGAGQDATFLSSAPAAGFVIFDQADVAISGFDITSGGGAGTAPSLGVGDATLTLTSCRIHDSNGGGAGGGAIEGELDANVSCTDVLFIANRGIAGAVYISGGNMAHFTRCRFENNATNRNINTRAAQASASR